MEKQKIFWVVLSVSIFIVVVLVVGVFLLKQNPAAETGTVSPISGVGTQVFEFDRQAGPAAQSQAQGQGQTQGQTQVQTGPAITEPNPSEPEVLKLVIGEGAPEKTPQTLPQPVPPAGGAPAGAASAQGAQTAQTGQTAQAGAQTPEKAPTQAAAQKPAAASAQSQAKPAAPAQKPAPRPAPRTERVVEYWIQTGSYKSQNLAEDLAHTLSQKGLGARVFSSTVGADTYFRVRIGPYANRSEAGKFLSLVKQIQGLESSYISSVTSVRTVN